MNFSAHSVLHLLLNVIYRVGGEGKAALIAAFHGKCRLNGGSGMITLLGNCPNPLDSARVSHLIPIYTVKEQEMVWSFE